MKAQILLTTLVSVSLLGQQPTCATISSAGSTAAYGTPFSIAFSPLLPGATDIYVAIGASNGFNTYALSPSADSSSGAITTLSKPRLAQQPVFSVAFSPTIPTIPLAPNGGSALLAVATTSPNEVYFYFINYAGNVTSYGPPFSLPATPASVAFSPVLASDQILVAVALENSTINIYSYSLLNGLIIPVTTIPATPSTTPVIPTSVAFSPLLTSGSYATLLAIATGTAPYVTIYDVDQSGNFLNAFSYPSTTDTSQLALYVAFSSYLDSNPNADFALGITNSGSSNNIGVYPVTGGGTLQLLNTYSLSSSSKIGFSPLLSNGDVFAAVTNYTAGNVELYSVSSTASLTPLPCNNPLTNNFAAPLGVAFSPLFTNGTTDLGVIDITTNLAYFFSFAPSSPVATVTACPTTVDAGRSVTFTINITGGTPPYSFIFNRTEYSAVNVPFQVKVSNPTSGLYTVSNITDCNGCPGTDSMPVSVTVQPCKKKKHRRH